MNVLTGKERDALRFYMQELQKGNAVDRSMLGQIPRLVLSLIAERDVLAAQKKELETVERSWEQRIKQRDSKVEEQREQLSTCRDALADLAIKMSKQ